MGFGRKQWYLYVLAIPYTLLVMLSNGLPFRAMVLPATFILMLILCCCLIANSRTLDFGKLSGYLFFSAVIVLCFYSLVYLKRCLPVETYQYDAVYFILLTLCFAWGGDSTAYFVGRFFGKHSWRPLSAPTRRWRARGRRAGQRGAGRGGHRHLSGGVGAVRFADRRGQRQALSADRDAGRVRVDPGHSGDLFASAIKRQVA